MTPLNINTELYHDAPLWNLVDITMAVYMYVVNLTKLWLYFNKINHLNKYISYFNFCICIFKEEL